MRSRRPVDCCCTGHSPRTGALVDLLLTTGVRISEALTVRVSGLSSDRLMITRNGGKSAAVWLPERTVEALRTITKTTGRRSLEDMSPRRCCSRPEAADRGTASPSCYGVWSTKVASPRGSLRTSSGILTRHWPWSSASAASLAGLAGAQGPEDHEAV